jgi:Mrp family chromosome partitioning ATPase
MKEASEQASLQTSDARFLTRATPPDSANLGTRLKIVILGLVGGILASAGLVFLLEQISNTFRNPSDVESETGLPVLAAIPHAGRRMTPKDMIAHLLKKPNSALAESVRNLRTSIFFSNIDRPPKVVMFSSSLPMEGKTTTAMLAAITSRQMGRSAVIIDCDLRRQTLSSIFPTDDDRPGLFAVLEGTASLDDAVYVEPETGLHVLVPGRAHDGHGNPADILASQRFQKLISELRARYDLVILDTPRAAASLVSAWAAQRARDLEIDAAILATRADIESLLMGDGGRLATGWRHDVVGEPIRALAAGEASLAVDPQGRLRLETRSGVALTEE